MDYLEFKELYHHGIKGQKWGVRRYENEDGTLIGNHNGRRFFGPRKENKPPKYSDGGIINVNHKPPKYSDGGGIIKTQSDNERIKKDYEVAKKQVEEIRSSIDKRWNGSEEREKLISKDATRMFNIGEYDTIDDAIKSTRDWYDFDDGDPMSQGQYDVMKNATSDEKFKKMIDEYEKAVIKKEELSKQVTQLVIADNNKKASQLKKEKIKKGSVFAAEMIAVGAVLTAGFILSTKK